MNYYVIDGEEVRIKYAFRFRRKTRSDNPYINLWLNEKNYNRETISIKDIALRFALQINTKEFAFYFETCEKVFKTLNYYELDYIARVLEKNERFPEARFINKIKKIRYPLQVSLLNRVNINKINYAVECNFNCSFKEGNQKSSYMHLSADECYPILKLGFYADSELLKGSYREIRKELRWLRRRLRRMGYEFDSEGYNKGLFYTLRYYKVLDSYDEERVREEAFELLKLTNENDINVSSKISKRELKKMVQKFDNLYN